MRRVLVLVLLICSSSIAAQTDERRVRTVQIDDAAEPDAPTDEVRDGAQHADEHLLLARKLVNLEPDSAEPGETGAPCVPAPEGLRRELTAAYRANPAQFHGISPQSAYWPDVEQARHDYYLDRFGVQLDQSPAAQIARSYAANLSTDQLREVVAFQESPSGRAFIAATARAREELESGPAPHPRPDPVAASKKFRETMLGLKAKYERVPK
jgi:hypothetical protein